MALKSTICKATLQVADMDRHYYAEHALTIARHPSETDERMMIRCLAFALNAGESLESGKGLSDADEPDLWQRDLTGAIQLWIDGDLYDDPADLYRALQAIGEDEFRERRARTVEFLRGEDADGQVESAGHVADADADAQWGAVCFANE